MCTSQPSHAECSGGCWWISPLRSFLLYLVLGFHATIDLIIDMCFSWYFKGSKRVAPPVKKKILFNSAVELATEIKNQSLTSEEVVQAYIDRIKEINPVLNCVVDDRFHAALEEAKKIDESIKNGKYSEEELKKKPFLGVPFSSKVSTMVKGLRHTIGLASRRNIIADEDADVVKAMREAGAIPLAVTNVPELGMWYETWCMPHGQTYNPYDTTRTTGGSSGGEACLVSACGSPIGIGTDIGGSLRMPAFFCGIFGHKPTTGLIPLKGLNRRSGNEVKSMVVAGPLCTHSEDLIPILRTLIGDKAKLLNLDAEVNPLKLKYYYMLDDSATPDGLSGDLRLSMVHQQLKRSMLKVVSYLKDQNASVSEVWISKMRYGLRLWRYWISQEPEKFARELADREGEINVWTELPKKILGMSDFSLPAMYRLVDDKLPKVNEKWARETTAALLNEVTTLLGDDGVLLYPSHPFPAFYRNSSLLRPYNFSYTAVLNVLNFPVTQVPLGLNRDGLPVGVQVVAGPHKDHLCLAVAKELEKAFGGWVPPFQST
ncbi:fatty-acid amide hydrolase 2-like [Ischnura elegans]|uniref:fatty-acid amide hydrolase 2-like n=1 Tax=Ischnura elegans TaxID=197161 RepID=UPI001ED894DC|nr:fatty-acid amide hydrolase 2-like [Ischnura elegans]